MLTEIFVIPKCFRRLSYKFLKSASLNTEPPELFLCVSVICATSSARTLIISSCLSMRFSQILLRFLLIWYCCFLLFIAVRQVGWYSNFWMTASPALSFAISFFSCRTYAHFFSLSFSFIVIASLLSVRDICSSQTKQSICDVEPLASDLEANASVFVVVLVFVATLVSEQSGLFG